MSHGNGSYGRAGGNRKDCPYHRVGPVGEGGTTGKVYPTFEVGAGIPGNPNGRLKRPFTLSILLL
jgi:hypothetical protein